MSERRKRVETCCTREGLEMSLFTSVDFPLRLRNPHQKLLVSDGDPAREHFHRVLEIGVEENLPRTVDEGCGCGVKDIKASMKRGVRPFGSG